MESRKIQKTGLSTMTVSLPKDWVESNNLKAGDQVHIEVQTDGTLSMSTTLKKKEARKSVVEIDKNEATEHLVRKLIGAYLAGFNIIEVHSRERMDLSLKHATKDFARLVIGPEVIEETSNTIIMHDLSDPVELPQKKCVRRMHLIVDSMHRDAMIAFQEHDADLARDVEGRDQDVDRLYWMTVKQFNLIQKDRSLAEKIGVNVHEGMSLMLVARMMERIGDHAEKIAKHTEEEDGVISADHVAEMKRVSDSSLDVLSKAVDAFFKKDILAANRTIDQAEELAKESEEIQSRLQQRGGKGAVIKTSIMDSIIRTIMYSTDIAEIAINEGMGVEKE